MPRSRWAASIAVLTTLAVLVAGGSIASARSRGVPASSNGLGLTGAPGQQTADAGDDGTAGPPTDYSGIEGLSQPVYQTERTVHEVTAFDGIKLYVEIEKPKDAPAGMKFPVILEASPYHGTLADRKGTRIFPGMGNIGLSGYFAPRGYAVAFMNLRGTGRSDGCLDHLAMNDARDLKTVIEWLADQPWSNGRVGMTGHSYVGATQVVAAAQDPRGLVTIVPSAGLSRMYDHQFQMGVPYNLQYAGPIFAYELLALQRQLPNIGTFPGTGGSTGDNFGQDMTYFGCGIPNSAAFAGHGQATGMAQNWHAARDWADAAARWDGDVFMVHGTNDNAARIPNAEWFFKLRDPEDHPGDKVWLGQWDHSTSQMGFRKEQWIEAAHAWFDNKLMQLDVDTGPPVEIFVNDDAAIGSQQYTYTSDSWADASGEAVTLFPTAADSSLGLTVPAAGSKSYQSSPNTFTEFTSAPLESETLLVGPPPNLKLTASTIGQRLNIITTLYADNGGSRRAINYCAMNVELRNGIYTSTPVVPGQEMLLEPQCFTVAGLVHAGEKLVLRIGAAGPHWVGTWTADPQVTIYTGPGKSSLTLPVVTDPVLYDDVLA
ncbi:MAG: CocE/NonD family hydrolase [Actinomycetota bacterium]